MSAESTLVKCLLSHADVKHRICGFAGGYAAADLLARLSKEARPLTETYLRQVSHRQEFLRWQSKSEYARTEVVRYANDAVCKARAVARRVVRLEAEEQKKFDLAFLDLDKIEERLANATKAGGELELDDGTRATLLKITGNGAALRYHCTLSAGVAGVGEANELVPLKRDQIKPEYLSPSKDTINESECGAIISGGFQGKVSRASLEKYRQKLKELEAGIKTRCVVEVMYNDFQKGHGDFKKLCEEAPTEAARLTYIAARAEEARMLPLDPKVARKKSRLGPLVQDLMDVAGAGFVFTGMGVLERLDAIIDRAEAELAKQPLDVRRDDLVRRRQAANRELEDINKQRKLYQEIKKRAPAINPADYPFTPMDAEARAAACEIERSLWSAPEGRPGRNTVASHRFKLPLCRSFDLGHLADKLRDGLSFLIPTSAIEVFPPEHYVRKMELGAKANPHLYPPLRE